MEIGLFSWCSQCLSWSVRLSCEIAGNDGQFLSSLSGLIWWYLSCPHCVCLLICVLKVFPCISWPMVFTCISWPWSSFPSSMAFIAVLSSCLVCCQLPSAQLQSPGNYLHQKTSVEKVWKVVLRARKYLNSRQRNKILQLGSLINMERVVRISCSLYLSVWL